MQNKKEYNLFLYTMGFPYGKGEPYLNNELPYLCDHFNKVVIFTHTKKSQEFELPDNTEVHFTEEIENPKTTIELLFSNLMLFTRMLFREFLVCENKIFFFKRMRLTISELWYAFGFSEKIMALVLKQEKPIIHYSFWMNSYPLALSILKQKGSISNYSFRVHGFDLYKERWPSGYIPFRANNYRYCTRVYAVSKLGLEFIRKSFSYSEKATYSYLGTQEIGVNPYNSEAFTVITCSTIIKLKRLDLLADSLMFVNFPLKWIHIGNGTEEMKIELKKRITSLPKTIQVEMAGQLSQGEIFERFKKESFSVFMNVSETEGLPVSIMEAISFGIPVIATEVGGVSEIVNERTGWLIDKDISAHQLADTITSFRKSNLNTFQFREGVRQFWKENFSAEKNYPDFCRELQKSAVLIPE